MSHYLSISKIGKTLVSDFSYPIIKTPIADLLFLISQL